MLKLDRIESEDRKLFFDEIEELNKIFDSCTRFQITQILRFARAITKK